MNLLVLGASSAIGSQLALEFARGNALLLVGRNLTALEKVAEACRQSGASAVSVLATDLETGYADIEYAAKARNIELVINAASATSRLRDNDLDARALGTYAAVDLVAPVRLIQALSEHRGPSPLSVIFVSSLLAVVRSPNRMVYGGLKSAQELFLTKVMESRPQRRLLIVRVGVPVPTGQVIDRTVLLAKASRKAFERHRKILFFGFKGRMLSWLYFAQPLVFRWFVQIERKFRSHGRS